MRAHTRTREEKNNQTTSHAYGETTMQKYIIDAYIERAKEKISTRIANRLNSLETENPSTIIPTDVLEKCAELWKLQDEVEKLNKKIGALNSEFRYTTDTGRTIHGIPSHKLPVMTFFDPEYNELIDKSNSIRTDIIAICNSKGDKIAALKQYIDNL